MAHQGSPAIKSEPNADELEDMEDAPSARDTERSNSKSLVEKYSRENSENTDMPIIPDNEQTRTRKARKFRRSELQRGEQRIIGERVLRNPTLVVRRLYSARSTRSTTPTSPMPIKHLDSEHFHFIVLSKGTEESCSLSIRQEASSDTPTERALRLTPWYRRGVLLANTL